MKQTHEEKFVADAWAKVVELTKKGGRVKQEAEAAAIALGRLYDALAHEEAE